MIFALKVSLLSGAYATGKWQGVIEIESSSTLEDFHFAIQGVLSFDNDHLYEFFSARTEKSRQRTTYDDENGGLYDRTIESLFPLPERQSLYYLFDYGDSWIFKITRATAPKALPDFNRIYPQLAHEVGEKPEQYPSTQEW